ncbi:hypothetical protein [Leisingera sp. F5]|uniref:hypothetical protein n=1 Tax=Leisingera sp. F5 TaxID=1813816 RepID=UPI0025C710C1|nr:hypothetical protein [Leisingera sp. F5]
MGGRGVHEQEAAGLEIDVVDVIGKGQRQLDAGQHNGVAGPGVFLAELQQGGAGQ